MSIRKGDTIIAGGVIYPEFQKFTKTVNISPGAADIDITWDAPAGKRFLWGETSIDNVTQRRIFIGRDGPSSVLNNGLQFRTHDYAFYTNEDTSDPFPSSVSITLSAMLLPIGL